MTIDDDEEEEEVEGAPAFLLREDEAVALPSSPKGGVSHT